MAYNGSEHLLSTDDPMKVLTRMLSPNGSREQLSVPRSNNTPLPFTVAYGILAFLVIIANGLIIVIFLKNREVRKRKCHLFLLSLSCADFLVGFCSLGYVFSIKSEHLSHSSKQISTIVLGFSLETSMFSLCCLTYERLVGVKDSLKYQKLVTSTTVNAAIIMTWLVSAIMTCTQGTLAFVLKDGEYFELNGVIIVTFALITSLFLAAVYVYLYKEIRRHRRDIKSKSISISNSLDLDTIPATKSIEDTIDVDSCDFNITQESMLKRKKGKILLRISKEKRSLIFCSFIVCSFIICWSPITIFFAGEFLGVEHMSQDLMLYISTFLVLVNSILDPIIYFALRKDMRRAAAAVFCKQNRRG